MKRKTVKPPTMHDVAKEAGVTQATVSYAINGTGDVSDAMRERVLAAADKLGYIPNIFARNLKTNRSNVIGVIVPDVMNTYYAEIIKHTERITRENGYFTFICNANHDPELEDWYVTSLIQQKAAGVLVFYGFTCKECLKKLNTYNIPFVVVDDELEPEEADAPSVLVNNIKGSFQAVQHFVSLGISDIAYCTEPLYSLALKQRLEGFHLALEEFGLKKRPEMVYIIPEDAEQDKITQGYKAAGELLSRGKVRGIFAASDQLAFGILKKLQEQKIKVPGDIAVIGYDNIPFSSVISPSLTTINQPIVTMCLQGANLLMNLINGNHETRRKITLEPNIIIRESTP